MTYRTVFAAVDMIRIRTHNEYARLAALEGIKLEMKEIKRTFEPLDDEAKKKMLHIHQEAIERKVKEKREKRT